MELLTFYLTTRKRTEAICEPLHTEDLIPQPADFASPAKWHLAHTTWFFEEMILKPYLPDYKTFNAQFSFLFNSYYNAIGSRTPRSNRGDITRPSVQEVMKYRSYVDQQMAVLMTSKVDPNLSKLITTGIHHEQQHQELLWTDVKLLLSQNPLNPVYKVGGSLVNDVNQDEGWIEMQEGIYEIGHDGKGFHFDNERGRHKVYLEKYHISKSLITNGDYQKFIEDGGYQNFRFWLDEGWTWVNQKQIAAPLYWQQEAGEWKHFTLGGLVPVNPEAILSHISFYEAAAFATWRGMRLPTEFEWEAVSNQFNWGARWEWTNSAYLPYPNFKIAEGALGEYNGKFMVNQMVLRGASRATAPGHSRTTYRNFFHPQHQWQFTGIRLVK